MKIVDVHLKNFKRFTNLRIVNIPISSKLVLLIGSNGSGKSTVFDAFSFIDSFIKRDIERGKDYWQYFEKIKGQPVWVSLQDNKNNIYQNTSDDHSSSSENNKTFYGRSSFRQIPRLTRTSLGQSGKLEIDKDTDRPKFLIERDLRFENDIEKITEVILKEFFRSDSSKSQIKQKFIDPLNKALENIFGSQNGTKLQLIEIIPPLEGKVAQITFKKGISEFHYDQLSAGEKEVFNVLFNLLSRRDFYQESIYYLDEIDLHLSTKIQYNLLKEITENWIPEKSQLWAASHSLGFIEYAKEVDFASIIDFDDYDFDQFRILQPVPKDNTDIYNIAVGKEFLPSLFKSMKIVFVENQDKAYYGSIGIPNTVFVAGNDRNNVFHKVKASEYYGLVDRDFLSDDDIFEIKRYYPRLSILKYYSIENYLFHPDNIIEFNENSGIQMNKVEFKDDYIRYIVEQKNELIERLIPSISLKRTEYPYFGEPKFNGNHLQNRFKNRNENFDQCAIIASELSSNVFEKFYKYIPMKSYLTDNTFRANIPKSELARTKWFKNNIESIL